MVDDTSNDKALVALVQQMGKESIQTGRPVMLVIERYSSSITLSVTFGIH